MDVRKEVDASRFFDLDFREVVAEPIAAVRRVYGHFDLPLTRQAEARFADWRRDNPPGKHGEHRYDASDFGISDDAIRDRFARYIRHFSVAAEKGDSPLFPKVGNVSA